MLLSGTFTVSQTQSSWYCWTAFKHNACMYGSSFPDTTCVTQHILFQPPLPKQVFGAIDTRVLWPLLISPSPRPQNGLERFGNHLLVSFPDFNMDWRQSGMGAALIPVLRMTYAYISRPIFQPRTCSTIIVKCPHTHTHTHTHTHSHTHTHTHSHTHTHTHTHHPK